MDIILLTEKEAAEILSLSVSFLQKCRIHGSGGELDRSGPPYIKVGRSVRYRYLDLICWVESIAKEQAA
jgi:hypothetical protein